MEGVDKTFAFNFLDWLLGLFVQLLCSAQVLGHMEFSGLVCCLRQGNALSEVPMHLGFARASEEVGLNNTVSASANKAQGTVSCAASLYLSRAMAKGKGEAQLGKGG